jgi:hypothetical protein
MSQNGYDRAFAQATEERADIRLKIEQLLTRGEMLDKLLECLAPFVTSPQPVEDAGQASHDGGAHHEEHHHHHDHHQEHLHHEG